MPTKFLYTRTYKTNNTFQLSTLNLSHRNSTQIFPMCGQKTLSFAILFLFVIVSSIFGENLNASVPDIPENTEQATAVSATVEPILQTTTERQYSSAQSYHEKQQDEFQTNTTPDFPLFPRKEDSQQFWNDHPEFKGVPDLPANSTNYPTWLIKLMSQDKSLKPTSRAHSQDQSPSFLQNDRFIDADQHQQSFNHPTENGRFMHLPAREFHARRQWLSQDDTSNEQPIFLYPVQSIQTKFVHPVEIFPLNSAVVRNRDLLWRPTAERVENTERQRYHKVFDRLNFNRELRAKQYYPGIENNGFESLQQAVFENSVDRNFHAYQRNIPIILAKSGNLQLNPNPNFRNKLVIFSVEPVLKRDLVSPLRRTKRQTRGIYRKPPRLQEFDDDKPKNFVPKRKWPGKENSFRFNDFQLENRWSPFFSPTNFVERQKIPIVVVKMDKNAFQFNNNGNDEHKEGAEASGNNQRDGAEMTRRQYPNESNFLFVGGGPWMPGQWLTADEQSQNTPAVDYSRRFHGNIFFERFPYSRSRNNKDIIGNSPKQLNRHEIVNNAKSDHLHRSHLNNGNNNFSSQNLKNDNFSHMDFSPNIAPSDRSGKILAVTSIYSKFNGNLKDSVETGNGFPTASKNGDRRFQSLLPLFPNWLLKKFSEKKVASAASEKGTDSQNIGPKGGDVKTCLSNCSSAANSKTEHSQKDITREDKSNRTEKPKLRTKDVLPASSSDILQNRKKLRSTRKKRDLSEFDFTLPNHHVQPFNTADIAANTVDAVSHQMAFHSNNFLARHEGFNLDHFGKTFSFHEGKMKQQLRKDIAEVENQRHWFESFSYPDWRKSVGDGLLDEIPRSTNNNWNIGGFRNHPRKHWASKYSIPVVTIPRANPNQISYTARYRYRFGIYPGYTDYKPNIDSHKVYYEYDPHYQTAPNTFLPFRTYQ
ncbi:uncharacterized protein LOC118767721 [Octopus sinensis]|uniref:Uncharacterized protein LOC118767721 n=1 Tax=Octopus sinensis TaxID=2607531 RepID=A0A7E6FMJ4_9MOLL|nr:uncharacterized protein LOC118767721 [Octopus sinensis]